MLTPSMQSPGSKVRSEFMRQPGLPTDDHLELDGPSAQTGVERHYAVVADDSASSLLLYVNGAPQDSVAFTYHLSDLNDINNWLGRSQFQDDPALNGTLLEFRIYDVALSESELETSFTEGPDAAFLD